MNVKTRIFKLISVLLILVVFAGLGCVDNRAENESARHSGKSETLLEIPLQERGKS